ncbi:hypothetical protein GCM10029963_25200 [Micromonospora andamanensis]
MALSVAVPAEGAIRRPVDDTIGPAPMKWIEPQKVRSVPVREVPGKSATPPRSAW